MGNKLKVELTHSGQVARLTLAAPKANILDRTMMTELVNALDQLNTRESLKAIVVAGEGPNFSFGASIEEHLPDQIGHTLAELHGLLRRILLAPAPTIAAVCGQCLGGGFELALACDFIIAEEPAQFGLPEIKLGVFPPAGAALLPVRIGASRAAEMVLTGASWTATQAQTAGLVHRITPTHEIEFHLDKRLQSDFLPRSAVGLRCAAHASRRPVLHALEHDLPAIEKLYLNEMMGHPDGIEGILAFLEKRRPHWNCDPAA